MPSRVVDVTTGPKLFDGRRAHSVQAFKGKERYSLVFFSAGKYWKATKKVKDFLSKSCGAELPNDENMPYYIRKLPAAKGFGGKLAGNSGKNKISSSDTKPRMHTPGSGKVAELGAGKHKMSSKRSRQATTAAVMPAAKKGRLGGA